MSAQATGNVWKYAECHGSKLVVLLAVADIANDVHNNEVWIGSGKLAEKCRMDPRNVRRRLKELVDDGWLIQLQLGGGMGKPSRYQFVPQDETGSFNPVDEVDETGSERSCTGSYNPVNRVTPPDLPGHTARPIYNSIETKGELKEHNSEIEFVPAVISKEIAIIDNDKTIVADMFEEFWDAYGRKEARKPAVKAWNKMIKDPAMASMVIAKARENCAGKSEKRFIKLAGGWLLDERWEDEIVETRQLTNSEQTMINLRKVAEEQGLI